jgi:Protein of unknown function (DUF2796)
MEKSMSILLKKGRTNRRPKNYSGAVVVALGTCLVATSGFAASHGDHEHDHDAEKRHAESHEHGAAELAIALDGNQLIAEFTSPGMNIVGFEHEAKDADDIAAVKAAVEKLGMGAELIELTGAGCSLSGADVEAEGLLAEAHEGGHHEEDHHEGDEHKGEDAHAEFEATYTFNCVTPDQLSGVSVSFFEHWSGIEEIEAVFLSDDHQISAELTGAASEFEVK